MRFAGLVASLALFAFAGLGLAACSHTPPGGAAAPNAALAQEGPMVPDFPSSLAWLNTDRPVSLKELRGKVVLLDFWTFG